MTDTSNFFLFFFFRKKNNNDRIVDMSTPRDQRLGQQNQMMIIPVHHVVHPNVDSKRFPREVQPAKSKLRRVGLENK